MKTCKKCLKDMPLENFYIRNVKTNLRRTVCKTCMYEDSKKYKELNKEKTIQQQKDYRIKNKDRLSSYIKNYNIKNKDRLSEVKRKYYDKNIDIISQYNYDYYKKNKEDIIKKVILYTKTEKGIISKKNTSNKRRLIKKNGNIDTVALLEMKNKSNNCYWCDCKILNNNYHLDHYIPLSKGGSHTIDNIVISCPSCNLRKSNKDPYQFALSVGKLL